MLGLIVELDIHPEHRDSFLSAIEENATRSQEDEAGCHLFSVSQSQDDPCHFTFFEIYEDEAAFEAHRHTAHFARWRKAADQYVVKGSQVNRAVNLLFKKP